MAPNFFTKKTKETRLANSCSRYVWSSLSSTPPRLERNETTYKSDDCTETSTCVSCRHGRAASHHATETARGQTRVRQATMAEDQAKPAAVRPKVGGQPREQQKIQTAT